jgi:hypothetical protein
MLCPIPAPALRLQMYHPGGLAAAHSGNLLEGKGGDAGDGQWGEGGGLQMLSELLISGSQSGKESPTGLSH